MAQYDTRLTGSFDALLNYIDEAVMAGSSSASREGGSEDTLDGVRFAVRVYERYSVMGGNRLSLCVTLFGRDGDIRLTAVSSGGSQAIFHKINTWGEKAFLDRFVQQIEQWPGR